MPTQSFLFIPPERSLAGELYLSSKCSTAIIRLTSSFTLDRGQPFNCNIEEQESRAVAGKLRDTAINFDRYRVCRTLHMSHLLLLVAAKIEYNT